MKYKVRFINYPRSYKIIKKEIDGALQRVLSRGDLVLREDVERFEKRIAKYTGAKYGIGCGCCTDGLFLSLKVLGVGAGDEVITVAHTYVATIDTIVAAGATPILVDVGKDYNMDMSKVEQMITPRTKAIVPVHLNGRMCDMEALMNIAKKHDLFVVEDAAQALGAKFKMSNGQWKMAGSFGDTGCISFYPAKMLGSYGDAGIILTSNKVLAEKLYLLRDHGEKPGYLIKNPKEKHHIAFFGYNSLLDNIQAAILNVKFNHFPKWVRRRREIALMYDKGLRGIHWLQLPPSSSDSGRFYDVFQNYVIRAKERDALQDHLRKRGVETLVSWRIPNHHQKGLHLRQWKLPETESISREVLSLPLHPDLTNKEVGYVIKEVHRFFV